MSSESSRLEVSQDGRVLSASGVLDLHTANQLAERLTALGTGDDIRLELDGVQFIDSSGLRAVVSTHQALDANGHRLVLSGMSDAVTRLLEITGLFDHLHTQ